MAALQCLVPKEVLGRLSVRRLQNIVLVIGHWGGKETCLGSAMASPFLVCSMS